jgi:hypothetical protein
MTRRIGERFADKYLKHPAASTTNPLSDGWYVDTGTVMLAHNNVHHLERESLRHLVMSPGPGSVTTYANTNAPFSGLDDAPATASNGLAGAEYWQLPWDRRCCAVFGPYFAIQDYELPDGRRTQRKIRGQIDATIEGGASSYRFYFAATSAANETPFAVRFLAFGYADFAGTGNQRSPVIDLTFTDPLPGAGDEWRCRPGADDDDARVVAAPFYLFMAWKIVGGAANYINGFSAWEID